MHDDPTITVGIRGEIPPDLHRAIRRWMVEHDCTWGDVLAEAVEMWAVGRKIKKKNPIDHSASENRAK